MNEETTEQMNFECSLLSEVLFACLFVSQQDILKNLKIVPWVEKKGFGEDLDPGADHFKKHMFFE